MTRKLKVVKKGSLTPQQIAEEVAAQIEAIEKKYNCQLGVWLTWRDLLHNFDVMKKEPKLNELQFSLQIRLPDGSEDEATPGDKG